MSLTGPITGHGHTVEFVTTTITAIGSTLMESPSTLEAEFVFCLLESAGGSDAARSRIEAISDADPDWDKILHLVSQHRLHSIFREVLNDTSIDPPEKVTQILDERYRQNTIANLEYSRQLHELNDLFDSNEVAGLSYKGPVLAEVAYGGVGNRSFGDLDFLVAKSDVKAACDLLERHGYERVNFADIPVETLVDGVVFRWGREFRFVHPYNGLPVELRFGFIGGSSADSTIIDDLWNRRVSTTLAGRKVLTLSPEDRALLLLVHGTKHGWRQLTWVYDIALILQQDIDWETVLARADQYGWRYAVLYGLGVVAELTGLPVPEPVRAAMNSKRLCSWGARRTANHLRSAPDGNLLYLEPITTATFLNDNFRGVFVEGVDELLAPRKADYELISLPPMLHPLYYAVRAYRLSAAKSRNVLNSFRRF